MARISDSASTPQYSEQQPLNGKRILIAEDDPFISRMYETKLSAAGYEVIVKNTGREAYEDMKRSLPDLVMLDLNMPELSGLELLAALAADDVDMSHTPVMVLTNSSNPKDRDMAQRYGAEYLIKAELTPRDVLDRINQKLGMGEKASGGTA